MIDVFNEVDGPVLAVERVPRDTVSSYGIIDAEEIRPGVYRIRDLVEKPPIEEAPSDLAIIGRYVLTPDIFPALETIGKDRAGEIQLTNGLRQLLKSRPIYGCRDQGRPPRHREQARVPEGGRLLRAAASGSRRAVPRIPAHDRLAGLAIDLSRSCDGARRARWRAETIVEVARRYPWSSEPASTRLGLVDFERPV